MGQTTDFGVFQQILIVGITGMAGLAIAMVLFVLIYQRRLFAQQKKLEEERSKVQRERLKSALAAQEKERTRIGQDLHDDVGSTLATIRLYLQQLHSQPDKTEFWLDKADETLMMTVKNLQGIVKDLVPTVLNRLGLVAAVDSLSDTIRKNSNITINYTEEELPELPSVYAINLYRIIQELFNNALKHAEATCINIKLNYTEESIILEFSDNGKGMQTNNNSTSTGLGLTNIQSRLSLIQGSLDVSSSPCQGTKFSIQIPFEKDKWIAN